MIYGDTSINWKITNMYHKQ